MTEADVKSYYAPLRKNTRLDYTRYFADMASVSVLAEINNKGIECALTGRYLEAEILFYEVLKEDADCPYACNNLGLIHELNNNKDKAFSMYSKACLLEPENKYYRWNFSGFCDSKF